MGRARRDPRAERQRQDDAARRAARPAAADVGNAVDGSRRRRRRARPGPRACCRPASRRCRRVHCARPGCSPQEARSLLAKFGLGADHVERVGRRAVARRAHTRRARPAHGAGRELPRARRADQPPRPARHRAARAGARDVGGHAAARHPRPPLLDAVHITRTIEIALPSWRTRANNRPRLAGYSRENGWGRASGSDARLARPGTST